MILIGENINIMSKTIGPALRERDAGPIQKLAEAEAEAGIDYLDINIGPARKTGEELMDWVVKTVQEVVDKPLSLDTTNVAAIEAALKVHKGQALINSISLARMDEELPLVTKYNAEFIGLLWGREGMPRDEDERSVIAAEMMMTANEAGIDTERIWFDPIVTPASNVDTNQVKPCLEFMGTLADIAPGGKSAVGLSNVSNGTPTELRPYLNRTYLMMLMKHDLYSAIVDAFDTELIAIARGKRAERVAMIHRIMDGDMPDVASLEPEEAKYAKSVRVLTGEVLYSHSWLDL